MKSSHAIVAGAAIALLVAACAGAPRPSEIITADMSPAALLSRVCVTCHGIGGTSIAPNFPRLAGQQPDYIVAQLNNFRDRSRADPQAEKFMWDIAAKLSDAQIRGVADILGRLPPAANTQSGGAATSAGKRIYEKGIAAKALPACMTCHGPNGEGFGAFPRLANQHQNYLLDQLRVFRSGHGRPDTPMAAIAPSLSEEEMFAVTDYLQGMPTSP